MIKLSPSDFYKVRPLFEPLMAYQMFCAGVLNGLYSGQVFVDDSDNPRNGLVSKDSMWWFLAGDAQNEGFNKAINTAIFDRTLSGEKGWGGMLVCYPDDWDVQIPVIFAPRIPIKTNRLHYLCRQMKLNWRTHIPGGFEVRFVDQSLVEDGIEIPGTVANVLALRKDDPEPDHKAAGFVALHNQNIVAYAVIDCIVNKGGDIGLYTDPEFRHHGLAYVTSAAIIEYALSHDVEVVHWDCESFNMGSIRTAEKLGLQLSHEHTMYHLILDPVLHEVNRAWSHLDAGRYKQAVEVCKEHVDAGHESAHPHFYYVLARCCAESGRPDEAMQNLELAAKFGWDSADEMKADFQAMANYKTWDSILEQVQSNAQAKGQ